MIRLSSRLIILLTILFTSVATADTITLHPAVRLKGSDSVVRLTDIATLEGEQAARFADLIITDQLDTEKLTEIPVRLVRDVLTDAGAHWGHIHLRGRTTIIRPRPGTSNHSPRANAALTIKPRSNRNDLTQHSRGSSNRETIPAPSLIHNPDLGGVIARWFAQHLSIKPDDLKLAFASRDLDHLGLSTVDFRFELQPQGSLRSDRIGLTVRLWREGIVQATHTITVHPTLRFSTAQLTRNVHRGETITAADLEEKEQWVSPLQQTLLAPPKKCLGQIASKSLSAGELIRFQHIKQQTIIRRGDPVIVRCLVGGLVVTQQAIAREEGGMGDTIELRGRRERESFTATITGPGQTIVDLSK